MSLTVTISAQTAYILCEHSIR